MSGTVPGPWHKTGEYRIVPWCLGLMRAEQQERRDFRWPEDEEVVGFQLRWVRFHPSLQESDQLQDGFYILMAGDGPLRRFVKWWRH